MKRIELFEFEDFKWLPEVIRTGVTNLLNVFHRMVGTEEVISGLLKNIKSKCDFDQVVDLGSGSGGALYETFKNKIESRNGQALKLILTDLYPNQKVVQEINNSHSNIEYYPKSIDATNIRLAPPGLKTMIASFHHMKPTTARQILHSAEESKEPILIYEVAKNNIPTLLWWLLLPVSLSILFLMSLVMTPFIKRLSLTQFFFTFLIPIIPLVYAWDGQASLVRTYTFSDLKNLIGQENASYTWEIGDAQKANGKKLGYYLIGIPKS